VQLLHTSRGDITFETIVSGFGRIPIGELTGGGFARADGNPVLDPSEFDILPEPMRERALRWWEHRDDEQPDEDVRPLMFKGNELLYADTWEPVSDVADILRAFPDNSPFQKAALDWWGQRHYLQQVREQQQRQEYAQDSGLLSEPTAPPVDESARASVGDLVEKTGAETYNASKFPPRGPGSRLARKLNA
jgi:hypothetical protein